MINDADVTVCTCPRHEDDPDPIVFNDKTKEWTHADDDTFAWTGHYHVYTEAKDCDGVLQRSYTVLPRWSAFREDDDDDQVYWFVNEARADIPGVYSTWDTLSVNITRLSIEYFGRTEEGYRSGEIKYCDDALCRGGTTYRDLAAEAAGY